MSKLQLLTFLLGFVCFIVLLIYTIILYIVRNVYIIQCLHPFQIRVHEQKNK